MTIGKLLLWFYCMKIQDAALLLTVCTVLFCMINMKLEHRGWWKWLIGGLLAALAAAILYSTVGSRSSSDFQVNLIPFHSYREVMNGGNPELYRSNFMNAALFYPGGLLAVCLLPQRWPGWCRCLLTLLLSAILSAGIEYVQYRYTLGQCEIDDVIHNVAGALAGSLGALLISPLLHRIKEILRNMKGKL